jgi:hypothetical protein
MGLSASFYPQKILPVLAMGAPVFLSQFSVFSGFTAWDPAVAKIAVGLFCRTG